MSKTPIDFIGQEVACRTFGRFITEWQKKGLLLEALVAGSGCSVEDLRNKHARISVGELPRHHRQRPRDLG